MDKLREVPDPELGISIVDLGLVYDTKVEKGGSSVTVLMTLTSMGCPLFEMISEPIKKKIKNIKGVKKVTVDLTFDPPWTTDMMSEEAKTKLGFF